MKPFGASGAWLALWPAVLTPRALGGLDHDLGAVHVAGDDIASGVDQRVGGFGFTHRQRPLAGEDHLDDGVRIDRARAEQHRVDVGQHRRDWLGGDEPDLAGRRREAGGDAVHIVRLVEIGEVGARVRRIGVLVPQRRCVAERDVRIFLGQFDDERIVVAERGREDQVGAVEVDHRLHRLGDGVGLGDVLFLDDGDARQGLERFDRDGVRLVPAEIVLGTDIDDAEDDGGLRARDAEGQRGRSKAGGARFQQRSARKIDEGHGVFPVCTRSGTSMQSMCQRSGRFVILRHLRSIRPCQPRPDGCLNIQRCLTIRHNVARCIQLVETRLGCGSRSP